MSEGIVYLCGICGLRVNVKSVLCVECRWWIYSRCAAVKMMIYSRCAAVKMMIHSRCAAVKMMIHSRCAAVKMTAKYLSNFANRKFCKRSGAGREVV